MPEPRYGNKKLFDGSQVIQNQPHEICLVNINKVECEMQGTSYVILDDCKLSSHRLRLVVNSGSLFIGLLVNVMQEENIRERIATEG